MLSLLSFFTIFHNFYLYFHNFLFKKTSSRLISINFLLPRHKTWHFLLITSNFPLLFSQQEFAKIFPCTGIPPCCFTSWLIISQLKSISSLKKQVSLRLELVESFQSEACVFVFRGVGVMLIKEKVFFLFPSSSVSSSIIRQKQKATRKANSKQKVISRNAPKCA